ncbi:Ig-like domain-containing protein [Oerskovia sp. USHLN155]|uniref:Ig-like domain-containing protein n=1 Tax=Oerskovia sp. USHLN155 TaxID=3081288 RepID=UPI0030185B3E
MTNHTQAGSPRHAAVLAVPPTTRPPTLAWRLLSTALAALLVLVGVVAMPRTASAAELDAIKTVTLTQPLDEVHLWQSLRIEATWAVPDGSHAGDTFTLAFPDSPRVTGFAQTFDLKTPAGAVVGTCDVTQDGFACTLSSYVETATNVHGTLFFYAQVSSVGEGGTFTFTTGNEMVIEVPVPGGEVVPGSGWSAPEQPVKGGWVSTDGRTAVWEVYVPSEFLAASAGGPVVVTDTYDPRLSMRDDSLVVAYVPLADWNNGDYGSSAVRLSPGTGYVYTPDVAGSSFDLTFVDPVTDGSRMYIFTYRMSLPVGVQDGDTFANQVAGSTGWDDQRVLEYAAAGGDGGGDGNGELRLTKHVTGEGAASVPAGTEFTVDYTTDRNGATTSGRLTVTDGATVTIPGLAAGTVVTLSEVSPAAIDGVTWGEPVFSGEGVTPVEGGAQVTVGAEGVVEVALDNPVAPVDPPAPPVPPTTVPPTTVPPTTVPPVTTPPASVVPPTKVPTVKATPQATTKHARGALATTGATVGLVAGAAVLLVGAGATLVALRRRGSSS